MNYLVVRHSSCGKKLAIVLVKGNISLKSFVRPEEELTGRFFKRVTNSLQFPISNITIKDNASLNIWYKISCKLIVISMCFI